MEYEWKQWEGFKKLHAVKLMAAHNKIENLYYSACGVGNWLNNVFIEPPTTQIKCRNCKRELNVNNA